MKRDSRGGDLRLFLFRGLNMLLYEMKGGFIYEESNIIIFIDTTNIRFNGVGGNSDMFYIDFWIITSKIFKRLESIYRFYSLFRELNMALYEEIYDFKEGLT